MTEVPDTNLKPSFLYVTDHGTLESALSTILEERVIGLGVIGVNLGLVDEVGLLTLTVEHNVYIIELNALSDEIFDKGIKFVLGSETILKVVHNCRLLSDLLFHRYGITLTKVFDIEVAYFLKRVCSAENVTQSAPSLFQITNKILGTDYHDITKDEFINLNWKTRPLEDQHIHFTGILHLLPLYASLGFNIDQIVFMKCVQLYLEVVRDGDREEASQYLDKIQIYPLQLTDIVVSVKKQWLPSCSLLNNDQDIKEKSNSTPKSCRDLHPTDVTEIANTSSTTPSFSHESLYSTERFLRKRTISHCILNRNRFNSELCRECIHRLETIIKNNKVIDGHCENLNETLNIIKDQTVIAIDMAGVNIGCGAKIGLLSIYITGGAFVFDLRKAGCRIFDQGLRYIFESESILKVIHNCRMVSDVLLHSYKVKLNNVFDTEVAYILKVAVQTGKLIGIVPSLFEVFSDTFQISSPTYGPIIPVVGVHWLQRPLSKECRCSVVRNVSHLLILKESLEQYVDVTVLRRCVEVYIGAVRNLSREEAKKSLGKMFCIPNEIREIVKEAMPEINTYRFDMMFDPEWLVEREELDGATSVKRRRSCIIS